MASTTRTRRLRLLDVRHKKLEHPALRHDGISGFSSRQAAGAEQHEGQEPLDLRIAKVVVKRIHRSAGRLHLAFGVSLGKRRKVVVIRGMSVAL